MSDGVDRAERIALALEGLLPIVAMECSDFPSKEERERCVGVLVMADSLAIGRGSSKGELTALAKAVHWLSAIEPGPVLLGRHWRRSGSHAKTGLCPYRCQRKKPRMLRRKR